MTVHDIFIDLTAGDLRLNHNDMAVLDQVREVINGKERGVFNWELTVNGLKTEFRHFFRIEDTSDVVQVYDGEEWITVISLIANLDSYKKERKTIAIPQ